MPTVILFDADGTPLSIPMVGIPALDQTVAQAMAILRPRKNAEPKRTTSHPP